MAACLCCLIAVPTRAQVVVSDVKRLAGKECKWLHSQFLDACKSSESCGPYPDELAYSMALQRGMDFLEETLTAASRRQIEAAYERSCRLKTVMDLADLQRSVCFSLRKH